MSAASVGCESAGVVESISIGFDLDSPNPVAQVLDEGNNFAGPYFNDYVVTVAEGEAIPFSIVGRSESALVTWVIDLDIVVDGQEERMTVGGEGFLTSAEAESYEESWTWAWYEEPQQLVRLE